LSEMDLSLDLDPDLEACDGVRQVVQYPKLVARKADPVQADRRSQMGQSVIAPDSDDDDGDKGPFPS
jgi:hypothetical protein